MLKNLIGYALAFASVGVLAFGSTLSGRGLRTVVVHTADFTIVPGDCGTVFTNEGDAGAQVASLPPATVGLWFEFVVKAAQEIRIDPNLLETIALDTGVQQAAGKYITANAIGERITVECVKAGEWETRDPVGTWTVEA